MTTNRRDWTSGRLESLTGAQVKALLRVASGVQRAGAAAPDSQAADTTRLIADLGRAAGESDPGLLDRAARETTPVAELTRIKDRAKALVKAADDLPHREAAQLLYHVAVAAAFVHHGVAISSRPAHKQHALYERFAASWGEHRIGRLFREAAARVARMNPPG